MTTINPSEEWHGRKIVDLNPTPTMGHLAPLAEQKKGE